MLDRLALLARIAPGLAPILRERASSTTTLADRFEDRVRKGPDQTAVVFEGARRTYGEWNAAANRTAHWAAAQGLRTGDVVALLMENRPEFLATWTGLAKLGVTIALLNTNLTGRALAHAITAAKARHVVVGSECLEGLASAQAELDPGLEIWVMRDPYGGARKAQLPRGAEDLDAALADRSPADPDRSLRSALRAGDDLFYIYTSGTTGLPKAARFSHLRFYVTGATGAFAVGLKRTDVHYCALPLYHSAGGVMQAGAALLTGATLALRRKFSASAFWDDVREADATHFQYIGEFCRYLLNQPPRRHDKEHRIRAIVGNGLRADVWAPFQERFAIPRIVEFYGATEGNAPIMNFENKVGSVGRYPFKAISNARLVRYDVEADAPVRNARGLCVECKPGEVGELLGRMPERADDARGRFEGYTSKEATDGKIMRNVFKPGDAWFRSGDLLRQDAQGFFYFVDRIGDTYRWKGENVSTQEVAEALAAHPGLAMVNVYGVRVEGHDGRAGMAALQLAPGESFDGKRFFAHVDGALPRYAAPLFVRLLVDVEMTGTFKLRKVTLQEEGFDPARVSDPLYFRDDAAGAYVALTRGLAAAIASGEQRV
ncbi:MAG TPA: long-chain-acyl-CoA synthetase [Myxococcota bacterium]|nr:long-chain-acyl-CoA synthetase [Myxococcota bacterium]